MFRILFFLSLLGLGGCTSSAIISHTGTYIEKHAVASINDPRIFHDRGMSKDNFGYLVFRVCTDDDDCEFLGVSLELDAPYSQTKTGIIGTHAWNEAERMVCGIKGHYPNKRDIPILFRQNCNDYLPCPSERSLTICGTTENNRPRHLKILTCGFRKNTPVQLILEAPKTIEVKHSRWWRAPAAIAALPLGVVVDVASSPLQATFYSNMPDCEL